MKKTLIISHQPLSTYNNMGKTLYSLFKNCKSEKLCQLYLYPSIPNVDCASSYYQITDISVLESYYKFKVYGNEIKKDLSINTQFTNTKQEELFRNPKNKNGYVIFARDMMWKFSRYFNNDLNNWIEKEKPKHVFIALGRQTFLYDIGIKISKKYNIPITLYICDDYYFANKKHGLFNRINDRRLIISTKKIMKYTKSIVTISDEMKELYEREFNKTTVTIMTPTDISPILTKKYRKIDTLVYMGNIRIHRYKTLAEIGKALDSINRQQNTNYKLQIYTAEKNKQILDMLKNNNSIEIKNFVGNKEYKDIVLNSKCLLFVESFNKNDISEVKYSISTKIPDMLAGGGLLLCVAPHGISSELHLRSVNPK